MDMVAAREEAAFFAAVPGQGLTYEARKTQIQQFLAEAVRVPKDAFNLQEFHDCLGSNCNVPIPLLRFDYLGLHDEWELISRR